MARFTFYYKMMRKKPLVLYAALAAVMLLPSLALAQESGLRFGFGGGPVWPQGDFSKEAKGPAYHVVGSAAYQPSFLPFQIQTDVFFQDFRNVERENGLWTSVGGEWFREIGFLVNARYVVPTPGVQPYVLMGTGMQHEWYDDRAYWSRRTTNVGLNAGAGIVFPLLLGVSGFIEGRYMNLVSAKALPLREPATQPEVEFKTTPLTIGIRF